MSAAIDLVVYKHERDNAPTASALSWPELVESLTDYRRCACTLATCAGKKCPHKSGHAWSPVVLDGARSNANVRAVTVGVFDLDHVADDNDAWFDKLRTDGIAFVVHSTHNHRETDICLRLAVQLSRPVTRDEWPRLWSAMIVRFALPADATCGDPSRLYFLPSCPSDAPTLPLTSDGAPLDVDAVLATAPAVQPAPVTLTTSATDVEFGDDSPELIEHARKRLAMHGPAIEGSAGNAHTRAAWGLLVNDYALTDANARVLLEAWNVTCRPPWDLDELYAGPARDDQTWSGGRGAARREWEGTERVRRAYAPKPLTLASLMGASPVAIDGPTTPARPTIMVRQDQSAVTDDAERALALYGGVYVRSRQLVRVVRDRSAGDWLRRPQGMPVIEALPKERLRELLGKAAEWYQFINNDARKTMVPPWVVETLLARGEWSFPALEGIVDSPTMRADGSILDVPGYDAATRLIYDPGDVVFPSVPTAPTREDAARAFAELLEPFVDFPFTSDSARGALVALVLSVVGRPAIGGVVPMFGAVAPTPGSGKGLLVDGAAMIATGRKAPKIVNTADEDETRKRLAALAMESPTVICIDNVDGSLGSAALASVLTDGEINDRLLGRNDKTIKATLRAVWSYTGNNVALKKDLGRRVVCIEIDPRVEHPEDRHGFRHPDLLDYIRRERARLVVAALTLLRAYVIAGKPSHGLPAFGSFEQWDALVRGAIVWCGGGDPLASRERIRIEADSDLDELRALYTAWRESFGEREMTTSGLLLYANQVTMASDTTADARAALREALAPYASDRGGRFDGKALGYALRRHKGRVVGGFMLQPGKKSNQGVSWSVTSVE